MIWRLIAVIWVFALFAGAAVYFSADIFAMTQNALALDEAGRDRITWLAETGATVLGILGSILAFFKVVLTFVAGKSTGDSQGRDTSTNSTTFHGKVDVRGDLVGRDKVIHGGRDAG